MRPALLILVILTGLGVGTAVLTRAADTATPPATQPATQPAANQVTVDLSTGWSIVKEGEAEGTMEQDAKNPTNPSPHLLNIAVTKTAAPGKGRAGAVNSTVFPVENDHWYDITFTAVTERGSIGLVFSLETADGKVLARTTLPEIGRGGRRGGRGAAPPTTAPAAWPKFLVTLHARASDAAAHVVITPIEPTNIWLDAVTLTPRPSTESH